VPDRFDATLGDLIRIAVVPPMDATLPARARLFLGRQAGGDRIELRISEWKGDSFVAIIPCLTNFGHASGALTLTKEVEVRPGETVRAILASSARPGIRTRELSIDAGHGASCANRVRTLSRASTTNKPASGALSRPPSQLRVRPPVEPK
jgi:hypothetical protein